MRRTTFWFSCVVVAYGALLAVFGVQELASGTLIGVSQDIWRVAVGIPAVVLAALLLARACEERDALALANLLTWLHVAHGGYGFSTSGSGTSWRETWIGVFGASEWAGAVAETLFAFPGILGLWMAVGSFVWLSHVFPRSEGKGAGGASPSVTLGAAAAAFLGFTSVDAWYDANPDSRLLGGTLMFAFFAGLLLAVVSAGRRMAARYRAAEPRERGRTAWLFLGLILSTCLVITFMVLSVLLGLPLEIVITVYNATPLLVIAGAALTVFYTGGYDPRLALRRTTVYGLLGVSMATILGVVEELTTAFISDRIGVSENLGLWVGSFVSVMVVTPIARRIERRLPAET